MKKPTHQPTLFPQTIPQMPAGYYTPGPNPNLRQFIADHAKPYDPADDDYRVPPFDRQITIQKRKSASMDLHIYWSKKPHDAIAEYIRHYTHPNDLVLDPFCGSGGTALAALMEGRAPVAIDLSPAATFITKNYCTPVDPAELERAFAELQGKVQREMDWLYETRCDRCDGHALTAYTVYSNTFQCPRCLEKVILFDCVETDGVTAKGKPKKIKACPHCYSRGHIEEIRSQSEKFGHVPVLVSYLCQEGCKPQRGERRHNDQNDKKRLFFEQYDLGKLAEIESHEIPYWYPQGYDMTAFNRYERDALRLYGVQEVSDLFTKRNLWALAIIRHYCVQSEHRDFLLFTLNTAILTVSRMCRHDWPSVMAGTYYLPQISRELNVWENFSGRLPRKQAGITEILESLKLPIRLLISTQSATELSAIPTDSIDYIFTDPPYADKVQYGELNFVWEAWLDLDTQWHDREIIVNSTRGFSDNVWADLVRKAMSECYRVLKPGRWLSLCYHDTSEGTWQLIQDLMAEVGFISEFTEQTLFIDTGQKSYNQLTAEKVTKRDLVINFRKPRPDELPQPLTLSGDEDAATFTQKATAILHDALELHPGSPADRLYDELVSRMVRQGSFERHNFDDLLRGVAESVNGRWYLLETADQLDAAESAKEETAADHLTAYMSRALADDPAHAGVHYSDLFEQYLPLKDKPRRLLQAWLPEFFFRTADGGWRPPANAEEAAQKAALRSSGALRRIKRFANALLEGVPPADRDRPESVSTAADWLRQCRRAGLYAQGRALYEMGGFDFYALGETAVLELEEDYQVCVRRS